MKVELFMWMASIPYAIEEILNPRQAPNRHLYEKAGWTALPNMTTLYGEANNPDMHHDETAMMIFLSWRATQKKSAFENGDLFVGEEPW